MVGLPFVSYYIPLARALQWVSKKVQISVAEVVCIEVGYENSKITLIPVYVSPDRDKYLCHRYLEPHHNQG